MSVMPVPHFRTLYVAEGRVWLQPCDITIGQLGRLHLTAAEKRHIKDQEREGIKAMAFGIIKKSSLPVVQVGRTVTEPRIGIAENGRIVLNSVVTKAVGPIVRALLAHDPDTNRIAVMGLLEGAKLPKDFTAEDAFSIKTDKGGQQSLGASGFLKKIGYEYAKAGSQSYPAEFNEKMKAYVITLPKETPARRPITPRKAKAVAPAVAPAVNGAPAAPLAPPPVAEASDDELVLSEN